MLVAVKINLGVFSLSLQNDRAPPWFMSCKWKMRNEERKECRR